MKLRQLQLGSQDKILGHNTKLKVRLWNRVRLLVLLHLIGWRGISGSCSRLPGPPECYINLSRSSLLGHQKHLLKFYSVEFASRLQYASNFGRQCFSPNKHQSKPSQISRLIFFGQTWRRICRLKRK